MTGDHPCVGNIGFVEIGDPRFRSLECIQEADFEPFVWVRQVPQDSKGYGLANFIARMSFSPLLRAERTILDLDTLLIYNHMQF
jgi:hypothetical protein